MQHVRICGKEGPDEHSWVVLNSLSLMKWSAISEERIVGFLFFENDDVTGERYRNGLVLYAFPRFDWLQDHFIFQQNSAPSHYSKELKSAWETSIQITGLGWVYQLPGHKALPIRHLPISFGVISNQSIWYTYRLCWRAKKDWLIRCTSFLYIRTEVQWINKENLNRAWDNTKLRYYFIMKVEGGYIENITDY